jgi:hypothetical protein
MEARRAANTGRCRQKPVPLSRSYTQGEQPILVAIEDGTATVRFRNGAVLTGVPIRDLVNDSGYWKG